MTYSVTWLPAAEQELAELWLTAPDRAAVTEAANTIDELLRKNAAHEGESRSRGRRILFSPPLGVIYRVQSGTRHAIVLHVGSSRRSR